MMVTIFLFSFSWQWTDDFYSTLFYTSTKNSIYQLVNIVQAPRGLLQSPEAIAASTLFTEAINNTCGLMILAPLLIVYLFAQNALMQGIERSGIVG